METRDRLRPTQSAIEIDSAVTRLVRICDSDTRELPQWLAYLGESIEAELGEGWLYDLETLIRERRERGGW